MTEVTPEIDRALRQALRKCTTPVALLERIGRARDFVASMTPEAREAYFAEQRRASVLAEMALPNEDATVSTP